MIQYIKRLRNISIVRNSSNYFLGNIATSSIAFFSIPIFTNFLTPEDYGNVSLFLVLFSIFTIVFSLGFEAAISNKFLKDKNDFDSFLGTNLMFLLFIQLIFLSLFFLVKDYFASLFNINEVILKLACYSGILMTSYKIYQSYMKSSLQSLKYVMISIIYALLCVGVSVILVLNFEDNKYIGRIYGYMVAIIFASSISFIYLFRTARFHFKKKHLFYALSFSIPFIPHLASQLILSLSDRVIINQLSGVEDTGLYSFAYNIGTIMLAIITAIMPSIVPSFYDSIKTSNYEILNKKIHLISKFIFLITFSMILFGQEIVFIMANKDYHSALNILPWIISGYIFFYFYCIYSVYATYEGKTGFFSMITLFVGLINIFLNYILIPIYGYKAAAITTLISYALLFIFHYCFPKFFLQKKVIPLKSNIFNAFIYILFLFIWMFFIQKIEVFIIKLAFKIVLLLLFAFSLYIRFVAKKIKNIFNFK